MNFVLKNIFASFTDVKKLELNKTNGMKNPRNKIPEIRSPISKSIGGSKPSVFFPIVNNESVMSNDSGNDINFNDKYPIETILGNIDVSMQNRINEEILALV